MRYGYACINMTLQKNHKITTNRSMIKRTFAAKGIDYASELAVKNTEDLVKVIQWNNRNGFKLFRMSSKLFPWASEYRLEDLPDFAEIRSNLEAAGKEAMDNGQRLSFHPGPFNILTSPHERVVQSSYTDLRIHGEIMDLMGMPRNHWAKINIHIGASYGDHQSATDRWCKNFEGLPDSVKSRLTVENDDKESLYGVSHLHELVYARTGVPIVFDYHHHRFVDGGLSERDALHLAVSTWPDGIKPTTHYSDSRSIEMSNDKIKPQAHSDYIFNFVDTHDLDIDIMFEAKAKELAVINYMENLCQDDDVKFCYTLDK
jgi:UV DNA damage endonuclease